MEFKNAPPKWGNEGTKPLAEEIQEGYEAGDKVPAPYLNYHLHETGECIEELQTKLTNEETERKNSDKALDEKINNAITQNTEYQKGVNEQIADINDDMYTAHLKIDDHISDTDNPHGVTAEQVGLGNVDNTKDSEKNVAFASEAGTGRKVKNPMVVRFKGGSTEGTDMFTFDGSTSKSVNITPDKIGAAKNDLSNVDDEVFKEKVESTVTTGTPIVSAVSTDGETYTATVDGITELYNGLEITIIPNMTSTKAAPQFNLNGLGAKNLRLKIDGYNSGNSGTMAAFAGWLGQDCPITIRYISKFDNWQTVDFSRPSASGLYGTIKPTQGGTGISEETGITAGNFLVGNGTEKMLEKTPTEVKTLIGLGNVPNVATNDQTPTYSDTTNLQTLSSGEKLNVAFQKIKCAITNLINHLNNKSNPHGVTAEQSGAFPIDCSKPTTSANFYTNNKKGRVYTGANNLSIHHLKNGAESQDKDTRFIELYSDSTDISNAFKVGQYVNGELTRYNLWGQHNLPYPAQTETKTYRGTGETNKSSEVVVNFNSSPKLVFIYGRESIYTGVFSPNSTRGYVFAPAGTMSNTNEPIATVLCLEVTWSNNNKTLTFSANPNRLNYSSITYDAVAIY